MGLNPGNVQNGALNGASGGAPSGGGYSPSSAGGGGKKGSGAPAAPDFNAAAERQAQSSQNAINQQTQANRPNQSNAFGGSLTYGIGPDGRPTQTQTLGGPLGDAARTLEGQVAANSGQPLDNGTSVRQQAIDATYGQAASRLDPQWQQRESQTRSQLAAQGLDPGSEAFGAEMGNFSRGRNDAYGSAMNSAITNANQAQALTFGENLAAREAPLNELSSLRGFTEMPGFSQSGAAQPTQFLPAAAAQYGGALQGYSADQAGKNSKLSGGASLAGAVPGFINALGPAAPAVVAL